MLNFLNPIEEHYVLRNNDGTLEITKQIELYCGTVHAKSLKQVFEIYFTYLNIDSMDIERSATIHAWAEKLGLASSDELRIKIEKLYNNTLLNSPEKLI